MAAREKDKSEYFLSGLLGEQRGFRGRVLLRMRILRVSPGGCISRDIPIRTGTSFLLFLCVRYDSVKHCNKEPITCSVKNKPPSNSLAATVEPKI